MGKIYIAYGSNMNIEQMQRRCPDSEIIGSGTLKGYEITFRGNGKTGVANIEKKKGGSVPVVVWNISRSDERSLDIYEGFPSLYVKKDVTVDMRGTKIKGMAYVMTEGHLHQKPSMFYLEIIANGYDSFGMDADPLLKAAVEAGIKRGVEA